MKEQILETQLAQGRLDDSGDFPKVVLIDTVSYCNLKCSMCVHVNMTRKRGIMKWDLFKKIIDEIAQTDPNVRVWMVFFGESLILRRTKPSIFDVIEYAKKKGLKDIVLNSNLNILEHDDAERLINAGLDAIYIGIDAFTPETYAKLRVGGNYEKVVRNVKKIIETKKKLGKTNPEVFVQFVEMDVNRAEIPDFVKFWNEAGANAKIRPKVSWGGAIDAPNLVLGEKDRWPCYWAMRTINITDQGKVVNCAVDLDAKFVAGDLNNQTIKEVWTGKLKENREKHLEHRFSELPEICRNCKDWQSARADYYAINPCNNE